MAQATYHFPQGFLWGTATAAHQVEGENTNNNWAAWEEQPGRILHGHRSGLACNWWGGRWREDFDRAAEDGQNAHRLSIEWSRIQPEADRWDESALDHYRQILRGLVERKITPMVTLHHFTDPLWLVEQGGWENDDTPRRFADFVGKVAAALKEYVSLWVTINEPNVYVYSGYLDGAFPPGKNDSGAALKAMTNMVRGHAAAYRVLHKAQKEARVGVAINFRGFWPARPWLPLDGWVARILAQNFNESFLRALRDGRLNFLFKGTAIPEAVGTQDFVGVNYYTGDLVTFEPLGFSNFFNRRAYPKEAEQSETGFIANLPHGLYEALKWARRFDLPILITENGVEDAGDVLRPRYTLQHLHQVWRAVNYNWQVKGYFHWSLVDNFEWERGWTQRFGLWELDLETQKRTPRRSAEIYARICKENAISSDLVAQYTPQIYEKLFPT